MKKIRKEEAEFTSNIPLENDSNQQHGLLLKGILDASLSGIYALQAVKDTHGRVVDFTYLFANKFIVSLLKLPSSEVIGSSILELIPENRNNGFFDLFCRVLESGVSENGRTHFRTSLIDSWFEYVIVPIDENKLVVTVQDVTEQTKIAEEIANQKELLSMVVNNAKTGLIYCRSIRNENNEIIDFRIVLCNDMAAELAGYRNCREFSALTIVEIHERANTQDVTPIYIKVVESGQPHTFEYNLLTVNRWYTITVVKIGDGFLTTCVDITQIKELQLQLEEAVLELQRSNQDLEEFAYAASHDLKEPIRKIQVFAGRLKNRLEGKLEEQDLHYFHRLETGAVRMNNLIEALLRYSHVSRGMAKNETVDLNEVINLALEDLELIIENKQAQIHSSTLPTITGHKRQLQQLFENLLSNSLRYSRPGVLPEVFINCDTDDLNHVITISDNGTGFPQEDAERIFNVFTRLGGHSDDKGTGLGLAIARKVVENHGGRITAEGEVGRGATFRLVFPRN